MIEIPHHKSQSVKRQGINPPAEGKGQEDTVEEDRNRRTYGPYWHLYIGHYDAEKYKKAMEKYKRGRLKSYPNGRRWCKIRYNAIEGEGEGGGEEPQSDLDILMAKYNFTLRDLKREERKRKTNLVLKRGML